MKEKRRKIIRNTEKKTYINCDKYYFPLTITDVTYCKIKLDQKYVQTQYYNSKMEINVFYARTANGKVHDIFFKIGLKQN